MIDFNKYKKDIDLPSFLTEVYGFKEQKGSSRNSRKLEGHGFYIVVKKNNLDQYTWFNLNGEEKGKTILDLVSKLEGCDLVKASKYLDEYLLTGKFNPNNILNAPSSFTSSKNFLPLYNEFMYLYSSNPKIFSHRINNLNISLYSDKSFLTSRGIHENIVNELLNNNQLPLIYNSLNIANKDFSNIAFLLTPFINDEPICFSIRNKGFKQFLGSHSNQLCFTNILDKSEIKHIFVGESMIDCLSHYQLHKDIFKLNPINTVYISTEGNLLDNHIYLINTIIGNNELNLKTFNVIFDNDIAGNYFRMKLFSRLNISKYDSEDFASYDRLFSSSYIYSNSLSSFDISFTPKLPFSTLKFSCTDKNELNKAALFFQSIFWEFSKKISKASPFVPSFQFTTNHNTKEKFASFNFPNVNSIWESLANTVLQFRFGNSKFVNNFIPPGNAKDFNEFLMTNTINKNNNNEHKTLLP